ncbi:STAS domain-containing protein [Candidatus Poribacteria bacterium]|nr:STAS domain-containing protein [Candidatus Poribacteria bacterium]
MVIRYRRAPGCIVFGIEGGLVNTDVPALRKEFKRVLELIGSSAHIVIDMTLVNQIDSAGIGSLMAIYSDIVTSKAKPRVAVVVTSGSSEERLFRLTKLDHLFPPFGTVCDAVAYLTT